MTTAEDELGFVVDVDYDVRRWILMPAAPGIDRAKWAADTAKAWAKDCHRKRDLMFVASLTAMLQRVDGYSYAMPPDAVFVHVLTPQGEPPDLTLALLHYGHPDAPGSDAASLLASYAESAIEPPSIEAIQLPDGAASLLTAHLREIDASVRTVLNVCWQAHAEVATTLTMSGYEIGRVLVARNDLVALAGAVHFRFGTAAQLAAGKR